ALGPLAFTLKVSPELHGLSPRSFAAFTYQPHIVWLGSDAAGANEHVPPDAQPASCGDTARFTATPSRFCTSSQYEVAPPEALHWYVGVFVFTVPLGAVCVGAGGTDGPGALTLKMRPSL